MLIVGAVAAWFVFDQLFVVPRVRRKMLLYIAAHPDEWVSTLELRQKFGGSIYILAREEEAAGHLEHKRGETNVPGRGNIPRSYYRWKRVPS